MLNTLEEVQFYGYSLIRLDGTPYNKVMAILDELDNKLQTATNFSDRIELIRGRGLLSRRLGWEQTAPPNLINP